MRMKKEEKINMSRIIERINNMYIPPYIKREIGLKDNWQKSISPKKQRMAVKIAFKFKDALRKLSNS